jgi:hypothetical protein
MPLLLEWPITPSRAGTAPEIAANSEKPLTQPRLNSQLDDCTSNPTFEG